MVSIQKECSFFALPSSAPPPHEKRDDFELNHCMYEFQFEKEKKIQVVVDS